MRIVFFDGFCNLCNGLVDWLMRIDRSESLKFASLQGETSRQLLPSDSARVADPTTIIYLREKEILEKSTAILMILVDLGGLWKAAGIFLLIPKIIRDYIYGLVAKNRYKLFGKRESCRLPTARESARLLS